MELNVCQVDVFTDELFQGNPAGIVPDARNLTSQQMQLIARELNLSETVFVNPISNDEFELRFFTKETEVDFCGHGTIGAFYILGLKGYLRTQNKGIKRVRQRSKCGRFGVEIHFKDDNIVKIKMEVAKPTLVDSIDNSSLEEIIDILKIDKQDIGINGEFAPVQIIRTGIKDLMIPLNNKEKLDNLDVNLRKLTGFSKKLNITGIHVFYLPKKDSEIVYARNFGPAVGIDEESGTGTASAGMIYYLKKNNFITGGKLTSYQGEAMNRLSTICIDIDDEDNVSISGMARLVIDGILRIKS